MLWIIATFAAFFIKGLCGFANTLVFTSIMGFGAANVDISPVELILGYPSNMILTFRNRKLLKAKIFLLLSALVVLGSIPGALLLKNANVRYLKIVSGAVVLLIGIEMLLREYNIGKLRDSKLLLYAIGVLSGVLCGLFG
ncbi:MAG: sulfite exporter TauE/SafE family protein, partial [Lachnospiraceae bacterium]|nr:sulfite exporter TauE/SafE family protein [Lachnospiraceae bacterium]